MLSWVCNFVRAQSVGVGDEGRALKRKHGWISALGLAAGAYAVYVAVGVQGSLAQLRQAHGVHASGAALSNHAPARARVEPEASESSRQDATPEQCSAGIRAHSESLAGGSAAETDMPDADALEAHEPEKDSSILRQRALVDVAAQPEFAELLNSRDPAVRQALLDFFEED